MAHPGVGQPVVGEGKLSDPNVSLIQPSMAVDSQGRTVVACVGTAPGQPLSVDALAGRASREHVMFDPSFTLSKAGLAPVTSTGGGWGDCTTTVADPTVPGAFWIFEPYAQADGTRAAQMMEVRVGDRK